MMLEPYPDDSRKKMAMEASESPTKASSRHRVPPVAYDENDVVMRDIQERMREKRRKRVDLSRSRRANITNASFLLKLSLRANNRALAKALEEARCETRQDKKTIFEIQCSLEAVQHELKQSYESMQDLKFETQSLMDLVTHFQESESKQRKRIYEVKKLLNEVTGKYLMNTVTLIDQAAGICNTPSLSTGSGIFVPQRSLSVDNSRDTLSVPSQDGEEATSRPNIYYKKGCTTSNPRETTPEVNEGDKDSTTTSYNKPTAGLYAHEDTTPNRLSEFGEVFKRHSTTSTRHSRGTFCLDINEMRNTSNQCQTVEESGNAPPSQSSPTEDKDRDNAEEVCSPPPVVPEMPNRLQSPSSLVVNGGINKDPTVEVCLENTDYKETEMELTHPDEGHLYANEGMVTNIPRRGDKVTTDTTEEGAGKLSPSEKEKKKKVNIGKKSSIGSKAFRKIPKKLPGRKVERDMNSTTSESSVFDLSVGESFTKSVSPHHKQESKTYKQNLSTESEKSESGENPPPPANAHSEGNTECSEKERHDSEDTEKMEDSNPKTKRRSRRSHNKGLEKVKSVRSQRPDMPIHEDMESTVICSPFTGGEKAMMHRSLKPLSQVLTESSQVIGDGLEESFNALSRKPTFRQKTAKLKQKKKRLYDPKKSLDKELSHPILNSHEQPSGVEKGGRRKSSMIKKRQHSGVDLGEINAANDIINESLGDLLEESWMKDFLNDIDGEIQGDGQTSRKSKSYVKQKRNTFRIPSRGAAKLQEAPGRGQMDHLIDLEQGKDSDVTDTCNNRKPRRPNKIGTVCLKKKRETLPEDSDRENVTEEDKASRKRDELNKPRDDTSAEEQKTKMAKELNLIRRGTFDVRSNEMDDVGEGEGEEETAVAKESMCEVSGKMEATCKKRQSEEMSNDCLESLEEPMTESNKRPKMDGFEDKTREEKEPIAEVVKGTSGGQKSSSTAGKSGKESEIVEMAENIDEIKSNTDDTMQDESVKITKRKSRRSSRISEGQRDMDKLGKDSSKANKDKIYDLIEEYDAEGKNDMLSFQKHISSNSKKRTDSEAGDFDNDHQRKSSKLTNRTTTIDSKQAKNAVCKVPRPKKRVILCSDSSEDDLSHDDSSSSVELPPSRSMGVRKRSAIPKRRQRSENKRGNDKTKNEKGNIDRKTKIIHKDNFIISEDTGDIETSEIKEVVSEAKEKEGVNDLIIERQEQDEESKTEERGRNKKEERNMSMKSLQASADENHVRFEDVVARDEKENICAVDDSGDGKAMIISDNVPTHKEEVSDETGRRPSRQARTKAAKNLKEPSIRSKLRQGDPFTDDKLLASKLVKGNKGRKRSKIQTVKSKVVTALGDATNVI